MAYSPNNYYANPAYAMQNAMYQSIPQQSAMTQSVMPQTQQTAANYSVQPQVRTVYSEAEAPQSQIPIDGTTCYFIDDANGKIYTKRFDYTNGSFPFAAYTRAQPVAETEQPEYITVSDFEKRWAEKMAEIEPLLKPAKGGKRNDE